jgi:DnaJ-class molecular chaperone
VSAPDPARFVPEHDYERPDFIDSCWTCEGQGDHPTTRDREGVMQFMTCRACNGTGQRGAL